MKRYLKSNYNNTTKQAKYILGSLQCTEIIWTVCNGKTSTGLMEPKLISESK